MAATVSVTIVDGAPGNVVTIPGSGLTGGSGASVSIDSQGVTAPPGLTSSSLTLAATFAPDGSSVAVTIPDGIMSGNMTITAHDGTTATCALRARSQYLQSYEYVGTGVDTTTFATGELDVILREASSYADAFMMASARLLQVFEQHKYRPLPDKPPRFSPFLTQGREMPIVSVDQIVFVSAKDLVTAFNDDDVYVNATQNYIEILAYAIGNYALLGELEVIGYSANVIELTYTSGWPMREYPDAICEATKIIATALITQRKLQSIGASGLVQPLKDFKVDITPFTVPAPARALLGRYVCRGMA